MTEEFNEERARDATIETLRHAAMTLHVNRELCIQILREHCGAPGDAQAAYFLNTVDKLLGFVAVHVQAGQIRDAATKAPAGNAVH
jgi:hypothetical protein